MNIYIINDHKKSLTFQEKKENDFIYNDNKKLVDIKCEIDKCPQKKWEEAKKKVNLYEYIYTSSKLNNNICKITPISRSYFKIHEMIKNHNLLKTGENCACIAEGPGGFIHCINQLSKYKKLDIKNIFGITLISKDRTIPYWNQMILNNTNNKIINGKD